MARRINGSARHRQALADGRRCRERSVARSRCPACSAVVALPQRGARPASIAAPRIALRHSRPELNEAVLAFGQKTGVRIFHGCSETARTALLGRRRQHDRARSARAASRPAPASPIASRRRTASPSSTPPATRRRRQRRWSASSSETVDVETSADGTVGHVRDAQQCRHQDRHATDRGAPIGVGRHPRGTSTTATCIR